MTTTTPSKPTIVLVPGHWLGAWAWDEVQEQLTELGREAISLTLPGLDVTDPDRASRTLTDQVAALEHVVAASTGAVVIVAHSGANAPVTLLLDRLPELVGHIVWVDSGPATSGMALAPDFPEGTEGLELPPFEVLKEQASIEGLTEEMLARFRAQALPEPGAVLSQTLHLTNDARFKVPSTFVCCSIPSSQVIELVDARHPMFAEVASFKGVEYVDLPTGHWPMWSRPIELAQIIASVSLSN